MVENYISLRLRQLRNELTPFSLAVAALAIVILSPIISIFIAANADSGGLWEHLLQTAFPRYVANTLSLMIGVSCTSLLFGVTTAWLVHRYDFYGRSLIQWMLILPLAVPTYIVAYTYTDFVEYAGPVQTALREAFGWQSARDYWFPEIRSIGGASLVLGAVLYPYIYMMARTAFLMTPSTLFEAGMLARRNLFFHVALPLCRPAVIAGLALVLMETVSEFGAVEYFSIETITLGIFNVWLGMNSLPAAAQIASISTVFVIMLLCIELLARSRRQFRNTSKTSIPLSARKLSGIKASACALVCMGPIMLGFLFPAGILLGFIMDGHSLNFSTDMMVAAFNSIGLAILVTLLVLVSATFMGLVAHYEGSTFLRRFVALASVGYAFPGTILAIGVITLCGAIDRTLSHISEIFLSIPYPGLLTGGIGVVTVACVVRFQAIGYGAVISGFQRLPPNMMSASRTLGYSFFESLQGVILPLMRLPLLTGGLLVFVDVMKELPMTLLLRPFNFETLATFVYQFSKDELLEHAALPALLIVLVGIFPVIIMNGALRKLALQPQQDTNNGKSPGGKIGKPTFLQVWERPT